MITAAYTILKNEKAYIEKWLYYAQPYTYRVLLDTGSTDGSWELLCEAAKLDPGLIIEQRMFNPWRFDVARRYNLSMVPQHVDWCLSPDLDEYFSINTLEQMQVTLSNVPTTTNIACDRLDLYSTKVRVGPPHFLPTNKIHRRHDYTWKQPIYEYLSWIHTDTPEVETYNSDIYLIHDQDFKKQSRPDQYLSMLVRERAENPNNTWCLWYLLVHYYKTQQLELYLDVALDFINYEDKSSSRYRDVLADLTGIKAHMLSSITDEILKTRLVAAV
jgi:hypothetical protein